MMDSITRFAIQRIGLWVGEPYNPWLSTSVFAQLPRLLERAGRAQRREYHSPLYSLVEADDMMTRSVIRSLDH